MDLGLRGKPILVTAATSRLSRTIAARLAAEGAKVMLFGGTESSLRSAQLEIKNSTGNEPLFAAGDMGDRAAVENAVEETFCEFGAIYGVVNNCDVVELDAFHLLEDDTWQRAFESMLLSYVRCTRAVVPVMEQARHGRIVNHVPGYLGAKSSDALSGMFSPAISQLCRTIAIELQGTGILVNQIGRGSGADCSSTCSTALEQLPNHLPSAQLGRLFTACGRDSDSRLAQLAIYLCSDANSDITGQTFIVSDDAIESPAKFAIR